VTNSKGWVFGQPRLAECSYDTKTEFYPSITEAYKRHLTVTQSTKSAHLNKCIIPMGWNNKRWLHHDYKQSPLPNVSNASMLATDNQTDAHHNRHETWDLEITRTRIIHI